MDITVPPEVGELARRTREFIRDVVIPVEEEVGGSVHAAPDELRRSLQKQAEQAGLLAPHVPTEWGGCGLDVRGQSVVFEEAGYSLLGPLALNCSAPDEGNMHLLEVVASEEQKEKYLRPLAAGETRSCFAMTEPAPGSGSDPSMLSTAATKVDGGWRIDGRKWFISGARGAGFAICMARTSGAPGERGGATMFLVDADNPGMRVVRDLETLDEGLFGGHSEVVFDSTRIIRISHPHFTRPSNLLASCQTGFTAYVGSAGQRDARGDVVFVSAAAGAVGSAAGQFARLLGASKVIGSAGGAEKARILVDELGFDEGIDYRAGLAEGLAAAAPDGIDLYFDNVGGDHLVAALYALKVRGRVALCGMISTMEDASSAPGVQHLIQVVLKRLTIRGFIVRDHEDLRPEFEKQVANWLRTGELVSRQTVVDGLENAVDAFLGLLSGANVGKMLVRLSDDDAAAS